MPERQIYMDNNATTPLHPEVKKALIDAMGVFGNPSSLHGPGREARQLVEAARENVASFIGASPDEVKGIKLDDAYTLSAKDINRELGGLPEHKVHCSVLGDKALRMAINDYYVRHGMEDKVKKEEERVICKRMNVTDQEIEHAVLEGSRTLYELQEMTKVDTGCGECRDEVTQLLETYKEKHFCEM
jgi:bacterioferritin-associated ferredoxin